MFDCRPCSHFPPPLPFNDICMEGAFRRNLFLDLKKINLFFFYLIFLMDILFPLFSRISLLMTKVISEKSSLFIS